MEDFELNFSYKKKAIVTLEIIYVNHPLGIASSFCFLQNLQLLEIALSCLFFSIKFLQRSSV
jgi:hypothetical protein